MRPKAFHRAACALAILLLASAAHAAPIPLLTPHVPEAIAHHTATRMGAPAPSTSLTLAISLPMRDQPGRTALLHALYDPASPQYRHYLSVADFTNRFGPSASDYAAAWHFFQAQGLHIVATSANRAMIDATGSVADIERIFHTTIGLYRHPTENRIFIAPDSELSLNLSVPILHVTGLDTYALPKPRLAHATSSARNIGTGSGADGNFIGSDIRAAYYGRTELTGKGQKLGLMELAGWNPDDIILYFQTVHEKNTVPITGISTDGTRLHCGACDDTEQAIDIEYAASMAPGLDEMQIYVGSSAESVLNRMASDNTSKQLSTSWGWLADFATDDQLWQEMAAQGQTFLTASGDYSSLKASGPWPEEDANLTAVGGTDLVTKGPGSAWQSETGWADSAGGPSLDGRIRIEPYQLPYITVPTHGSRQRRNVPDIAGDANTNNIACFNLGCQGGWGGTSFASPIWAGMVALVNEKAALAGKPPVGFLNPALYAQGHTHAYVETFHDITSGTSGAYRAVRNYDLVTGFGSPYGAGLVQILSGVR